MFPRWSKLEARLLQSSVVETSGILAAAQRSPEAFAPARAERVVFVDLARAITVLMMVQGHALHVFLDPAWQHNVVFDTWLYLRGLTAPMFLMLAGVAFSIATTKYWPDYLVAGPRLQRRLRRFGFFLVLGYVVHLPVRPLSAMATMGPESWAAFLRADVLQLIATVMLTLQLLVYLTKRPQRFALVSLALALAVVTLTPTVRSLPWSQWVWRPIAPFLESSSGSFFPWFGWAMFPFVGAALGVLQVLHPPRGLRHGVLRLLVFALAATLLARLWPLVAGNAFAASFPPEAKPDFLLRRLGSALALLAAFYALSQRARPLPRPLQALAEESLVIYVVHLALFYGSIWNRGLGWYLGRLGLVATLLLIVIALSSMATLAYGWNSFKRRYPRGKRLARLAIGIALAAPLL